MLNVKSVFASFLGKPLGKVWSKNESIVRWKKKHSCFWQWLRRRFLPHTSYGLSFTLGILLSFILFFGFLGLGQNVSSGGPLVKGDQTIMSLAVALRNLRGAQIFLWFTTLGSWQIILSLTGIIVLLLVVLSKRREALFLFLTVGLGEVGGEFFKFLFHRSRPDLGLALISRHGYSFPSGHATLAVIFYGVLGYLIFMRLKKWWSRSIVVLATALLIFLIGISRIYLGVHWASDIFSGWLLGLSGLVFSITLYQAKFKKHLMKVKRKQFLSRPSVIIVFIILFVHKVFLIRINHKCFYYCSKISAMVNSKVQC